MPYARPRKALGENIFTSLPPFSGFTKSLASLRPLSLKDRRIAAGQIFPVVVQPCALRFARSSVQTSSPWNALEGDVLNYSLYRPSVASFVSASPSVKFRTWFPRGFIVRSSVVGFRYLVLARFLPPRLLRLGGLNSFGSLPRSDEIDLHIPSLAKRVDLPVSGELPSTLPSSRHEE